MSAMRTYHLTGVGLTPLLMHADDVEWADAMTAWQAVPENKKLSKAGDDRTPPWRWIGSLWNDGARVCIPADAVNKAVVRASARVLVPGGKNGKTFKEQSQSGMCLATPFLSLQIGAPPHPLALADIEPLKQEPAFSGHVQGAAKLGFSLFVKRATVGSSKHVRVRPRFDSWAFSTDIEVWDDQITREVLVNIFKIAGTLGLGDWRPSAPKSPGVFGRWEATIK